MSEPLENATPVDVTKRRITTEMNQLTHRIMTSSKNGGCFKPHVFGRRELICRKSLLKYGVMVQRVHKERKKMEEAQGCPQRSDIGAGE